MIDRKSIATLFKQQSFFPHFHLVFSRFSRIIYLKSVKIQTCRLLYLFVLAYLDNWVLLLAWKGNRRVLQLEWTQNLIIFICRFPEDSNKI